MYLTKITIKQLLVSLTLVITIAFGFSAQAEGSSSPYYTPKPGSKTRKALMDTARGPISFALKQRVIFLVETLRTDGKWAFLSAVPLQPNSRPLDWKTTPFADAWKADIMGDTVDILMKKHDCEWDVIDYVIGPTDVFWLGWVKDYQLPEKLFTGQDLTIAN